MSKMILKKAGEHYGQNLFTRNLEQYTPADPLFEYYTNESGKKKKRKVWFSLSLFFNTQLYIFCSGSRHTAFPNVTNSSFAPFKLAHTTSISLCISLASASAQHSCSHSSSLSSDPPSTSSSPTPSSSAKRARPISPPGSSAAWS